MPTFSTNALIESLQQQTEEILAKAIQSWQMMKPGHFSAQPAIGGWSASQCLSHLNGYGNYYLPLLEKAIAHATRGGRRSETFKSGWLGEYFTKSMEPGPDGTVAKKMKAFRNHVPSVQEDSDAVIAKFIEQQETLIHLLESAKGLDLNRSEIPISIAKMIRLRTGDTFRFLIAHNRRHVTQAQRALKAVAAPVENLAATVG